MQGASLVNVPLRRLLVVGDSSGIPGLLQRIPASRVVGMVAAENRPQYHDKLKLIAQDIGVPLLIQPPKLSPRYADFMNGVMQTAPDGLICNSYSMLIHADVLSIVSGRAFNVHAALLPRNRGPNPVQWALIRGDARTGVSLHVMSAVFDAGAVIDQEPLDILMLDTWVTLSSRLASASERLLDRVLPLLLKGDWQEVPQDESSASSNPRISPESFEIDFKQITDLQIYNLIRGQVSPLNGAYLTTATGVLRFASMLTLADVAELRALHA